MSAETASYVIDSNEEHTGVVIGFAHMGEDGVETFQTAMPPEDAVIFGQAVVDWAKEMLADDIDREA